MQGGRGPEGSELSARDIMEDAAALRERKEACAPALCIALLRCFCARAAH
jgi:hypothetical protein